MCITSSVHKANHLGQQFPKCYSDFGTASKCGHGWGLGLGGMSQWCCSDHCGHPGAGTYTWRGLCWPPAVSGRPTAPNSLMLQISWFAIRAHFQFHVKNGKVLLLQIGAIRNIGKAHRGGWGSLQPCSRSTSSHKSIFQNKYFHSN